MASALIVGGGVVVWRWWSLVRCGEWFGVVGVTDVVGRGGWARLELVWMLYLVGKYRGDG